MKSKKKIKKTIKLTENRGLNSPIFIRGDTNLL